MYHFFLSLHRSCLPPQLRRTEAWRASYGPMLVRVLVEELLLMRADNDKAVWSKWTEHLQLLTDILSLPSPAPQLQEKVLTNTNLFDALTHTQTYTDIHRHRHTQTHTQTDTQTQTQTRT